VPAIRYQYKSKKYELLVHFHIHLNAYLNIKIRIFSFKNHLPTQNPGFPEGLSGIFQIFFDYF